MVSVIGSLAKIVDQGRCSDFAGVQQNALRLAQAHGEFGDYACPFSDDWNGQPTATTRKRLIEGRDVIESQHIAGFDAQGFVGAERTCHGYGEGTLAAAEWAGPSECPLIAFDQLLGHAVQHAERRAVTDISIERVGATQIDVDSDRALVVPRDAHDI